MTTRSTSQQAYLDLLESGSASRQKVRILAAMQPGCDYSLRELCRLTGLDINAVSGRVNALKTGSAPLLEEAEDKRYCAVSQKLIRPVRLVAGVRP